MPMLDERKAAILNAVVGEYIETAEPVGSTAALNAANLGVSSATVRNEMAALDAAGYLTQPHTSAGRVPTEKGYRHFVDSVGEVSLERTDSTRISAFFKELGGELESMMKETATLLSGLTDYAAVVVDDSSREQSTIRSVQTVTLGEHAVLVVSISSTGRVEKQTFDTGFVLDDDSELRLQRVVGDSVVGAMPGATVTCGSTGSGDLDVLAQTICDQLTLVGDDPERVYVEGASKVVSAFDAIGSVSQVLTILERQLMVVSLISDVIDRGLKVAIGTETGVEPLEACSVVVSPYSIDGEQAGSIAVLGPTRMHYRHTMAAVNMVSRQLGRRLSER